jgi:hypothetical protein
LKQRLGFVRAEDEFTIPRILAPHSGELRKLDRELRTFIDRHDIAGGIDYFEDRQRLRKIFDQNSDKEIYRHMGKTLDSFERELDKTAQRFGGTQAVQDSIDKLNDPIAKERMTIEQGLSAVQSDERDIKFLLDLGVGRVDPAPGQDEKEAFRQAAKALREDRPEDIAGTLVSLQQVKAEEQVQVQTQVKPDLEVVGLQAKISPDKVEAEVNPQKANRGLEVVGGSQQQLGAIEQDFAETVRRQQRQQWAQPA